MTLNSKYNRHRLIAHWEEQYTVEGRLLPGGFSFSTACVALSEIYISHPEAWESSQSEKTKYFLYH